MEFETMKTLLDYGFSIFVLVLTLVLLMKFLVPHFDEQLKDVKNESVDNSKQIQALTLAITEQTKGLTAMMETCSKAFDDNRRTIEILLNRQMGK